MDIKDTEVSKGWVALAILKKTIMLSANTCTGLALAGVVGAKILSDAGYTEYSLTDAAKIGATGGALMGVSDSFILHFTPYFDFSAFANENMSSGELMIEFLKLFIKIIALASADAALAGVLGRLILQKLVEMPLEKAAAALEVGVSVITVPAVLILGCCLLCCLSVISNQQDNTNTPNRPLLRA